LSPECGRYFIAFQVVSAGIVDQVVVPRIPGIVEGRLDPLPYIFGIQRSFKHRFVVRESSFASGKGPRPLLPSRPAAVARSGREQVELPRPVFRDHFEIAGLPGRVLELDLDAAPRPAEFFDLRFGPDDPAEEFDRFRLLARTLLPALRRPLRGETLFDPELRPGGQAVPDLVLVPALERFQKLLEGRPGLRLPLGPDDGGELAGSTAP